MQYRWHVGAFLWLCLLLLAAAPRPGVGQGGAATLINTRRAADGVPWAGGDHAAFLMLEESRDLNGDGDQDDSVLHTVDVPRLRIQSLSLAVDPTLSADELSPPVAISGSTLAVLVSEADQGSKDLNGDGDTLDQVLQTVDLQSRAVTRTTVAGSELRMSGQRVVLLTPEAADGKDLNGDRDTNDQVLQVYDLGTKETLSTGLVTALFDVAGDWAVAYTAEAQAGGAPVELNGDRDTADTVAQLVDLKIRKVHNTRLEADFSAALTPRLFAAAVTEAKQGAQDLNGDRDTGDHVLHVLDLSTMETTNTGQDASGEVSATGTLVAFATEEAKQGAKDLNGDGDTTDSIAQAFDLTTRKATSTGQDASQGILAGSSRIAFLTDEAAQSKRDLNGDQDADDLVAQLFDPKTAKVTNLRLAAGAGFAFTGNLLAFSVPEFDHGERDLNGDRDTDDEVVAVCDAIAARLINTRMACLDLIAASERAAVFLTSEADQGETDMNGDRDADDDICQVYRLR